MAEIQGLFSTGNVLAARRKYSTSEKLWIAYNDVAKVAFFARGLKAEPVSDPKFRWFEQSLPQLYVQINHTGGYDNDDTSLVVDDSSPVRPGTVLKVIASGEQILVTANSTSTNTITVVRGWGTTTASNIADDAVLMIVGEAAREGSSLPEAITREPVEKYNYTQIFREPVKLTETEAATNLWAGSSDIKTKREIALQVHKRKIERAFLFGEPKEDTSTYNTTIRATGGLDYFIQTNVVNAGGNLTETEFEDWVRIAFNKGSDAKIAFLSPLVTSAVTYWAKNKLYMLPKDKTYGMSILEYVSPHGTLKLTNEKMLSENSTWNGYSFIVDMEKLGYRYLVGNGVNRDMKLIPNRQAAGDDLIAEEYLTECGLFLANEEASAKLKGVTSYS